MARSNNPPIVPRSTVDPTGQTPRVNAATRAFRDRLDRLATAVRELYEPELTRTGEVIVNAAQYEFRLSPTVLQDLNSELTALAEAILLEGGADALWFASEFVIPAYQAGTSQQQANLSRQSTVYSASRPSIFSIISSEPYQRRIGYLRAREFEEMAGFTADVVRDVSLQLSQGMAMGRNPRDIARDLAASVQGGLPRAERIARTEINNALRQARLDEAEQVTRDLGIETAEMHISALSPTTRVEHALRHGRLFTALEQRAWWSTGANSINCKCSTVSVLVDASGSPLFPAIESRAAVVRQRWEKQHRGEA